MKVFKLDKKKLLSKEDVLEITSILNKGGVVVVPTDTSYGLSALVNNQKGVNKVFQLKERTKDKTLSMAVRTMAQAKQYGRISCKPTKLWKNFLPGPMTLVVKSENKKVVKELIKNNTLAIRFIDTVVVKQLLKALGYPVTITSANKSGKADIYSLSELLKQYGEVKLPDAFIDAGKLKKNQPSTVVKCVKGERVEILRHGKISEKDVFKLIND